MIFGIKGVIGSGKDTVAKMIQYYYACKIGRKDIEPYLSLGNFLYENNENGFDDNFAMSGYEIRKFAYKLKQIAALILNCNVEDFERQEFKDSIMPDIYQLKAQNFLFEEYGYKEKTYRWFLQHFADHLKILLGKDYFVNELFSHYETKIFNRQKYHIDKENEGILRRTTKYPNWIISDLRFLNEAKAIKDRNGIIIGLTGRGYETHNHISELELRGIVPDFVLDNSGTIEETYSKLQDVLARIAN